LLEQASAQAASADSILKEVQDAGIYKAAENLRKAKAQEAAKDQQKLLGTMDLMLRAPAPAKDKKQAVKQPVSTQVSQKDLDSFVKTLSTACGKQFNAIMAGTAPAIHTFGEVGVNSTEGGCGKLEGALCDTEAHIETAKESQNRQMRSLQHVTGQGCLPSKCTQKDDLAALAGFMQSKAKEAVPGQGVLVKLSVDCTDSGGATAKVGYDSDSENHAGHLHEALSTKSCAARGGGAALAALAFAAAVAM